ncbi:MAG: hypothetical protein HC903_04530 [Methylacidiphilales bacterium]|nr:hypothetical protein [Candidatus Methylacidiphilales bacterium]
MYTQVLFTSVLRFIEPLNRHYVACFHVVVRSEVIAKTTGLLRLLRRSSSQ